MFVLSVYWWLKTGSCWFFHQKSVTAYGKRVNKVCIWILNDHPELKLKLSGLYSSILNKFIFEMSEKLSKSHETCKTCRKEIGNNDTTFYCIACGVFMHLTTPCTGITKEGINGILEIGQNIMLLCNDCVARNRRDDVMDSLINTRRQPELTAKLTFPDKKNCWTKQNYCWNKSWFWEKRYSKNPASPQNESKAFLWWY